MSYNGSNKTSSSFKAFFDRAKWFDEAYSEGLSGPEMSKKFNLSERHLYGLVDFEGKPVEIQQFYLEQLPLRMTNDEYLAVPSFFKQQLIDLQKNIDKSKLLVVKKNNSILNNITIHRAYEPPREVYAKWLTSIVTDFVDNGINSQDEIGKRFRSYNITRFDQFVNNFISFCDLKYKNQPILYSSWFVSGKNPLYSSGLRVKISNLEYGDDGPIHKQIISSPEFKCYKEAVKLSGLAFDYRDPTVLTPDFGSPYLEKYINITDGFFKAFYRSTNSIDNILLYNILINLYNLYVNKQQFVIKFKDSCGKLKWDFLKLNLAPDTLEEANIDHLGVYLKLKSIEDPSLNDKQLSDLEKNSKFFQKRFDINTSIRYINDVYLNLYYAKPFSFQDIYNKVLRQEQEQQAQIGTSVFGGSGGFSGY